MKENSNSLSQTPLVRTVLGDVPYTSLGITDGHNHVWIDSVPGGDPNSPVLNQYSQICEELKRYHHAGGVSILDCQPAGCGRDGNRLAQLSKDSCVNIIACTGFHRRMYYPRDYWLFSASMMEATDFFIQELSQSLTETKNSRPPKAGFIKVALEDVWEKIPLIPLEAAATAARRTGAMVSIHTEKGALAEQAIRYFVKNGVAPERLMLCHMDKRADLDLHVELAKAGVLLEYDTFFRPKYQPETCVWPLILRMIDAGWEDQIVLATDMADPTLFRTIGNGPGLESLPGTIRSRLKSMGVPDTAIKKLLGGNIARRLAGLS